jgi:hypothetical protein
MGVGAGLLMVSIWVMGTRFGLGNGAVPPERVLAAPLDGTSAAALRERVRRFESLADAAETRAARPGGTVDSVVQLSDQAERYRAWARDLDYRAHSRDATLAMHDARRTLWVYSTTLDLLVCCVAALFALGIAVVVLRRLRKEQQVSRRFVRMVLLSAFLVTAVAYAVVSRYWTGYDTPAHVLARACLGPDVMRLVHFDDSLHVALATLFAVAGWLALAAPTLMAGGAEAEPSRAEQSAREIAESMRLTRCTLYVGATMLVVYVATVSALFHWTMAFVDPTDLVLYQNVNALTRSAVTTRSILATGLVVSVYGPASVILRLMAAELSRRALPKGTFAEREDWMKLHGLAFKDTAAFLKPVAAILAPLLTGPISDALRHAIA